MLLSDGSPVTLGGDGQADSPGHSAKFGSYTMIELNHKVVLDIELVQVRIETNFNFLYTSCVEQ